MPFSFKDHKISFLFAALAAFVVIFNSNRFWVLTDLSYILDNSYRMLMGEILYKDFVKPLPPGTFLIQEYLIKIFGSTLYPQIIYCCLISFFTYLLTYRILFFFNDNKRLNIFLALPVSLTGGYGILSQPFYDNDCLFFILISLFLVLYSYKKGFFKKFKLAFDTFFGFSGRPLRIASLLGMSVSLFGILAAIYIVLRRIISSTPIMGIAALMVVILIIGGLILSSIGIVGEYLW